MAAENARAQHWRQGQRYKAGHYDRNRDRHRLRVAILFAKLLPGVVWPGLAKDRHLRQTIKFFADFAIKPIDHVGVHKIVKFLIHQLCMELKLLRQIENRHVLNHALPLFVGKEFFMELLFKMFGERPEELGASG